jgi:hypothetical protein
MTTPASTAFKAGTPGIFSNVSGEIYHAAEGISNSLLGKMYRSPAHAFSYLHEPRPEPTPAMVLGTLQHTAIFEPAKMQAWAIKPEGMSFATKEGKEWKAAQAGRQVISFEDYQAIKGMSTAVRNHPVAGPLLALPSRNELSVFAKDEETGLLLKSRFDACTAAGVILELKTTEDSSPFAWVRTVAKWRYFCQHAFYIDQAARAGIPVQDLLFLVVEKQAPYNVVVYQLDAVSVAKGRTEYRRLLAAFSKCLRDNKWPGYSDQIEIVTIPDWALKLEPYESAVSYSLEAA